MLSKITPKDITTHKCHFCKRQNADTTYSKFIYLPISSSSNYQVLGGKGAIISEQNFIRVIVEIPICNHCKGQDDRATKCVWISIAVSFILLWCLAIYMNKASLFVPMLVGISICSLIIGIVVGFIIDYIVGFIKGDKTTFNSSSCGNYNPIRKLTNIGFSTVRPANTVLPKTYKLPSTESIYNTIKSIEIEDKCIVE